MNTTLINAIEPALRSAPAQEIHLIAGLLDADGFPAPHTSRALFPRPSQPLVVVLPPGPSYLKLGQGPLPCLVPVLANASSTDPVAEPILGGPRPKLTLITPHGFRLRVNGSPAQRVALLREGDQVQWSDDVVFQVAVFNRPQIGSPPADALGKPCPVCSIPFESSARVYVCPGCGSAFHLEEGADQLQCAQLRSECTCGRAINFQESYSSLPDWS